MQKAAESITPYISREARGCRGNRHKWWLTSGEDPQRDDAHKLLHSFKHIIHLTVLLYLFTAFALLFPSFYRIFSLIIKGFFPLYFIGISTNKHPKTLKMRNKLWHLGHFTTNYCKTVLWNNFLIPRNPDEYL